MAYRQPVVPFNELIRFAAISNYGNVFLSFYNLIMYMVEQVWLTTVSGHHKIFALYDIDPNWIYSHTN